MNSEIRRFNREFAKMKVKVLFRDKFECQMPDYITERWYTIHGHEGPPTVDHIRKRSLMGTNEFSNLITLCSKCHDYVDNVMSNTDKEPLLRSILAKKYHYEYD